MTKNNQWIEFKLGLGLTKIALLILPIFILMMLGLLRYGDRHFYLFLTYEDHALEVFSALIYLTATLISIRVTLHYYKIGDAFAAVLYGLFGVAMLLIFCEEISWGQRIFGIESSEFFIQHSTQKETNIHNLAPVQKYLHLIYVIIGTIGSVLWIFVKKSGGRIRILNKRFIPGWYLMTYFMPVAVFYFSYDYIQSEQRSIGLIGRDQEPVEFLLSLGFLLFIVVSFMRLYVNAKKEKPFNNFEVSWYTDEND